MNRDRTYLLRKDEKLFESVLDEFSKKCYSQASVNEIIVNSKYNKGSFYYRFSSKEEVYFAIIDYLYVSQISQFNDRNIDINQINDIDKILSLLWESLIDLNRLDTRYIQLLNRIFHEDQIIKDKIQNNCIESFLNRIINRISNLNESINFTSNIYLFIKNLEYYYYNFPYDISEPDLNLRINQINAYILGISVKTLVSNVKIIDENYYLSNLTFLLHKQSDFVSSDNIVLINDILRKEKQTLNLIREKLKIRQVSLKNIVISGISRNLAEFTHLFKLSFYDFYDKSYHLVDVDQKIILLITYNVLIGSKYIATNNLYNINNTSYIDIVFNEILPLLAKTSKILVIENKIPVILSDYSRIFYINDTNEFKNIKPVNISADNSYYLLNYLDENDYVISKTIKEKDFKLITLKDRRFISLKKYAYIAWNELGFRE